LTPVLVLTPIILSVLCLLCVVRVLIKLFNSHRKEEVTVAWAEACVARYQPMQALFDEQDFAFLSSQPGFDFTLYKKLRRERLRIFHQYLDRLIADYNRLHSLARTLVACTPGENSDMLFQLVKLKLGFMSTVMRAEVNYLLCYFGYRTLPVRALMLRLEELSAQVSAMHARQTA
jgi:hypothetical protein